MSHKSCLKDKTLQSFEGPFLFKNKIKRYKPPYLHCRNTTFLEGGGSNVYQVIRVNLPFYSSKRRNYSEVILMYNKKQLKCKFFCLFPLRGLEALCCWLPSVRPFVPPSKFEVQRSKAKFIT